MSDKMFCFQCQEAGGGKGCTVKSVCGKSAEVAALQDKLIYVTKKLCAAKVENISKVVTLNLFSTITNANFDAAALSKRIELTTNLIPSNFKAPELIGVMSTVDEDKRSLKELITYGLKGMAAYLYHANALGYDDAGINAFMQSTLAKLLDDMSVDELVKLALETGKVGVDVMALLDKANTEKFGNPEVTKVKLGVGNNPAILISGHDFADLEQLLEQTEGTGVDVYTHGEMLPAHYHPKFKKYKHFVGNYGNAWYLQNTEFEKFNGPILLTTNCLVPPKDSYKSRVFTTGAVGFEGCKYIEEVNGKKDFSEMIELAKKCQPPTELETGEIVGGFAHEQVFAVADKVVEAIKSGAIKKFVVMAGCDGRMKSRQYYADFAKALPKDAVILTAGYWRHSKGIRRWTVQRFLLTRVDCAQTQRSVWP